MTQSGQNGAFRTRHEQLESMFPGTNLNGHFQYSVLMSELIEAEARGAEEQRRKDVEGQKPAAWMRPDELPSKSYPWYETELHLEQSKTYSMPIFTRPTDVAAPEVGTALHDVMAERERQKSAEGWTADHDDQYSLGELAAAASAYAYSASATPSEANILGAAPPVLWPWDHSWWKPTTPRRDLIKAAALILAEIERLDRASLTREGGE